MKPLGFLVVLFIVVSNTVPSSVGLVSSILYTSSFISGTHVKYLSGSYPLGSHASTSSM